MLGGYYVCLVLPTSPSPPNQRCMGEQPSQGLRGQGERTRQEPPPLFLLCAMLIFQRLWDPVKRV